MHEEVVILDIYISDLMRAKINGKHGLEREDVEDACADVISMGWVWDAERGWRLFVEGWARTSLRLQVVLYPTDYYGVWRLGTAMPADNASATGG